MATNEQRTPSILVVDDEPVIVASLRGLFTLETNYRFHGCVGPREAVQTLENTRVDVVISDFLMPRMNGIDLLKEARRLQPEAARILFTGFADKENAIRAINEVGLYQYLEKPWDNDGLLMVVRNALQQSNLRTQLAEKISALDKLIAEHSELSDRHRVMEKELEMAAKVQRSLLPASFPDLDGFQIDCFYQPSTAVGGDFYDVALRPDGVVFLVSDVSGHGVKAALATMLLKDAFQETAQQLDSPVKMLGRMNDRLSRILPEGLYAATTIAQLNPASGSFELANAGLPYPFVLRGRDRRLDEITINGLPLALFGGEGLTEFEWREVALVPGDVLLLASDGISSIRRSPTEFFEDAALRKALAALAGSDGKTVIDALIAEGTRYGGSQPFPDDVSLLAITRTGG